jgi:DNA-binding response OmpR family regulator/DNA-binding CsgD family transcriptional regulator
MEEHQILIVDDDPKQLRILTGHLIESNPSYKLLIATNGKAGFEIAIQNKPDLILMDWIMPGISGLDTIRMLKNEEETKSIPVIMVTGAHNDVNKLKEALDAGAIDFINKPFNEIELSARVNTQIRHIAILKENMAQQHLLNAQLKELDEKEKQILKADITYHQKQLTMNTINLLKQGHMLQSVSEEIKGLIPYSNDEGRKRIKALLLTLNDKSSDHLWEEFEFCFEKVNSGFYNKLVENIPNISLREKRLCAFLKMNMSTKEIASITLQSPNAIDVAKHRLRKKLNISSEEDFANYLNFI